jgi:hypothetical protein
VGIEIPRVLLITQFVAPYRKTFYEKLTRRGGFEWLVVRGGKSSEDGKPEFSGRIDIPEVRSENREFMVGPIHVRWQLGAPDLAEKMGKPWACAAIRSKLHAARLLRAVERQFAVFHTDSAYHSDRVEISLVALQLCG